MLYLLRKYILRGFQGSRIPGFKGNDMELFFWFGFEFRKKILSVRDLH